MGQQRYIMSAVLILLFVFLLIGTFIKIPDWKTPKSDIVEIKIDSNENKMSANEEEGKKLYSDSCIACHGSFNVHDGAQLTLFGLENGWPNKQELIAYIRNSKDEKIKDNNNVKNVRERYSSAASTQNHNFKNLTDLQIKMILDYIHWEEWGRKK
jgi:mono/diheme cytochrome c family protein